MELWISFWKWSYIIGMASFFALVVILIPLGARDLISMFRRLEQEDDTLRDQ